ncbi:uncharacterized protein LOC129215296 [Grus americana]|uniref:uncharacterized protein LOC129215296 n=1 Tax=Grus americana TaxID=9117 RepID=UPI002407B709|nr:uncharacterized protein LOC129215296 [Grus americana]
MRYCGAREAVVVPPSVLPPGKEAPPPHAVLASALRAKRRSEAPVPPLGREPPARCSPRLPAPPLLPLPPRCREGVLEPGIGAPALTFPARCWCPGAARQHAGCGSRWWRTAGEAREPLQMRLQKPLEKEGIWPGAIYGNNGCCCFFPLSQRLQRGRNCPFLPWGRCWLHLPQACVGCVCLALLSSGQKGTDRTFTACGQELPRLELERSEKAWTYPQTAVP